MIKLLIADDEPLVQIGIKSMLNWADYNIEVCGTAPNGGIALEMIEEYSPQIVITDIRMPIMNGLELAKVCRETYGRIPLFIILTSYEEFELARQALSYEVVDYLIKLELDPQTLGKSIEKTIERLNQLKASDAVRTGGRPILQSYLDKFFLRLLHNLFDNEEQFQIQAKDLSLNFDSPCYAVAHCEILEELVQDMTNEKLVNLYGSTLQMVKDILKRHMACQVISLDLKHFAVIFHLTAPGREDHEKMVEALQNASTMVHNYFNVRLMAGIGSVADSPFKISDSYQDARVAFTLCVPEEPFRDYDQAKPEDIRNSFNITLFKNDLTRAFEEFDAGILYDTLSQIIDLFRSNPLRYLQAIDGACNILYLALSLMPSGQETISEIFSGDPDNYRSIYHMDERLTLNEVSAVFGLSPNYLSVLFKKTCGVGFSEYITQMKISRARVMLLEQDMKIYEVADQLGFESAFYFSKVFKKVEGVSPREFVQQSLKT